MVRRFLLGMVRAGLRFLGTNEQGILSATRSAPIVGTTHEPDKRSINLQLPSLQPAAHWPVSLPSIYPSPCIILLRCLRSKSTIYYKATACALHYCQIIKRACVLHCIYSYLNEIDREVSHGPWKTLCSRDQARVSSLMSRPPRASR